MARNSYDYCNIKFQTSNAVMSGKEVKLNQRHYQSTCYLSYFYRLNKMSFICCYKKYISRMQSNKLETVEN